MPDALPAPDDEAVEQNADNEKHDDAHDDGDEDGALVPPDVPAVMMGRHNWGDDVKTFGNDFSWNIAMLRALEIVSSRRKTPPLPPSLTFVVGRNRCVFRITMNKV